MSYKVTIHLDFESKPNTDQILDYVNELGKDLDYELRDNSLSYEDNFDQGDIRDYFKKATIVKENK